MNEKLKIFFSNPQQSLFEKRRQMEESEFMDQRLEREKRFKKKIDDLREQDADEYNNSRIALEKSIQDLEVHLEKMMATYQYYHYYYYF